MNARRIALDAIDAEGRHRRELLDVAEYRYVIARHMRGSTQELHRAQAYAARCFEVHGVVIDLTNPLSNTA